MMTAKADQWRHDRSKSINKRRRSSRARQLSSTGDSSQKRSLIERFNGTKLATRGKRASDISGNIIAGTNHLLRARTTTADARASSNNSAIGKRTPTGPAATSKSRSRSLLDRTEDAALARKNLLTVKNTSKAASGTASGPDARSHQADVGRREQVYIAKNSVFSHANTAANISILGASRPCTVLVSNLAPGTKVADILVRPLLNSSLPFDLLSSPEIICI